MVLLCPELVDPALGKGDSHRHVLAGDLAPSFRVVIRDHHIGFDDDLRTICEQNELVIVRFEECFQRNIPCFPLFQTRNELALAILWLWEGVLGIA